MSVEICQHCGHAWQSHVQGRCACGCMWTEVDVNPPPPPLPTERDLLILRIAKLLYEGVRQACDGYVEGYEQYGDTDPTKEVVDGAVDFRAFAKHVIDQLELT